MMTQIFVCTINTWCRGSALHLRNASFAKGGQRLDFCVTEARAELMEVAGKAESSTLKSDFFQGEIKGEGATVSLGHVNSG